MTNADEYDGYTKYMNRIRTSEGADLHDVFPQYSFRENLLHDFVRRHRSLIFVLGGLFLLLGTLTVAAFGQVSKHDTVILLPDGSTWICDTVKQMHEQVDVNTRFAAVGETPYWVDGCGVVTRKIHAHIRARHVYENEHVVAVIFEFAFDELNVVQYGYGQLLAKRNYVVDEREV